MLRNNGKNDLTLDANGAFRFSDAVAAGNPYVVTIARQPDGQTCAVSAGQGTADADVGNVRVVCAAQTHVIGGTVSGLAGTLVLRDNGIDELHVSANGSFSFAQALPHGAAYDVTVRMQPVGQACTLANASGTATASITSVVATCVADPTSVPPPIPAPPSVSYAPKAFIFSWANLPQATFYRLGEDPTNSGTFSLMADNLTGTSYALQDLVLATSLIAPQAYRYALQACNSTGCSPWSTPVLPDPTKAIGYFKRPANSVVGQFGSSQSSVVFSPDGSLMAIAQPYIGAIQLYRNDAGNWAWMQTLGDPDPGSFVPTSLSFSGQGTLLAGSPLDGNNKVNVYTLGPSGWTLDQSWVSPGAGATAKGFGQSVSISLDGSVAVVAEIGGAPDFRPGAFHVFRKTSNLWATEQTVASPAGQQLDVFGVYATISADGSTVVVGAQYEDGSSALLKSGAAYVYSQPAGSTLWTLNTRLVATVPTAQAWFGTSVGVSANGDAVAIGARYEADAGLDRAGALYVFRRNGATYGLEQRLSAPVPQTSAAFGGFAVAFSNDGSLLATSSILDGATSTGVNGAMTPGGPGAGAAFLYEKGPSGWQARTFIKAPNPDAADQFGYALALSGDGKTLAVGALYEASTATGIGGDTSNNAAPPGTRGAVYLY